MKNTLITMSALLAIAAMGSLAVCAADEMRTTTDASLTEARPIDASPLHLTPVILGEVVNTSEHSVTLTTARGETMTFETDSRTVMPVDLASNARVKVEFHLMDNGMHHAGRITTLQPGSTEWTRLEQQLSMLQEERNEQMAMNSSDETPMATTSTTADNGTANNEAISSSEPATDVNANQDNANNAVTNQNATSDELPRTASNRTWMLVLGLGIFAAAFGQRMVRKNGLI